MVTFKEIMESPTDGVRSPTVEKMETFEEMMQSLADGKRSQTAEKMGTFEEIMESLDDGVSSKAVEKIGIFDEIMESLDDGVSSKTVEKMGSFEKIMESLADGVSSKTLEKMGNFEELMESLSDGVSSKTLEKMETFYDLDCVILENGSNHVSMSKTLIVETELTSVETSFEAGNADVGVAYDAIVKHGSSSIEEKVGLEHSSKVENVKGSILEAEMNGKKGVQNVEACDSSLVFEYGDKFDGVVPDLEVNKNPENDNEKGETSNDIVNFESSSIEKKVGVEHGDEVENLKGSVLVVEMNGEKGVGNVEAFESSLVFGDGEKLDGVVPALEVNKNAKNDPEKRETNNDLSTLVDNAIKDGRCLDDKACINDNGGHKTVEISKYNTGDFVWGKIKNHPWWPGQIYDPSDASELALKQEHMNHHLVAYSGDGTFAWCKPFQLKPFHEKYVYFSKQSNGKGLVYALQMALEQIGELVEWNMTCSCTLKRHQTKLSRPIADNWGVKSGVLMPTNTQSKLNQFEPTQVLADLKRLSQLVSVDNMLELVLMKSKLSAFYRAKSGYQLPVYHFPQNIIGLEDNNSTSVKVDVPNQTPPEADWFYLPKTTGFDNLGQSFTLKNPFISEEKFFERRKQMRIAGTINADMDIEPNYEEKDKLDQTTTNEDESMKMKQASQIGNCARERKKSRYLSPPYTNRISWEKNSNSKKVSQSEFMSVPSSVKISERTKISKSKLFSSPSSLFKISAEKHKKELSKEPEVEMVIDPIVTEASPSEMLSKLCDAAAGHLFMKGPKSLDMTMVFFSTFRGSVYCHEPFYKLFRKRASYKKRKFAGSESGPNAPESISIQKKSKKHKPKLDTRKGDVLSAALLMTFSPGVSLPSKDDLIETYSEFGSLDKEQTNVMVNSSCAQVVFVSDEDGSSTHHLDHNNTSESPSIEFIKQKLDMMKSVIDNSDCTISEEMRNNLMGKLKTLLDKVSTM